MRTIVLSLFLALISGCDSEPKQKPVPMGSYPTDKYVAGAGSLDTASFGEATADCTDDKSMFGSAFGRALSAMSASSKPQILDYGIDDLTFADRTKGKIMAVLYSFEPGDPGAVSHAVDVFVFDAKCRVVLLKTDPLD